MKLNFSFFVAFALALASLFLFSPPPAHAAPVETQNKMQIILIGDPGMGAAQLAQAIARAAVVHPAVVIVAASGREAIIAKPEIPQLIDAERFLANAILQPEVSPPNLTAQEIIDYHRQRTCGYAPPNIGYRGQSFSNPTRASPGIV